MNLISKRIQADKRKIFQAHPRQVDFQFNSRWYLGIRVAPMVEGLDITSDGYNPDTDTIIKINFQEFVGADGSTPIAPKRNEEIRAENVQWRIEEVTRENDDLKLHCRKRLDKI